MTIFSIFASNMVVETISRADVTFKLLHGSASQDELCTQQDIQIIEWNGYQSIKKKNNIINDDNVQLNNQNKNSSTKIINFNCYLQIKCFQKNHFIFVNFSPKYDQCILTNALYLQNCPKYLILDQSSSFN